MPKNYHLSMSVRGALLRSNKELRGVFRDDEGRTLTPNEARMALLDDLAAGHEVIPCGGPCEGFDYSGGGCPGHEVDED